MTRTLDASVNSYLSEPEIRFLVLCEIDSLSAGTLRASNGIGWLMVGANTYGGVGDFGGLEPVKESSDEQPQGLKITLGAVTSSTLLIESINENLFNKPIRLYRCFFNQNSQSVVNTPEQWFKGKINEINLTRGDEGRGDYIEIVADANAIRERVAEYMTAEDHTITYSGDTFFQYLDQIVGFKGLWGQEVSLFSVSNPNFFPNPFNPRVGL